MINVRIRQLISLKLEVIVRRSPFTVHRSEFGGEFRNQMPLPENMGKMKNIDSMKPESADALFHIYLPFCLTHYCGVCPILIPSTNRKARDEKC